MTVDGAVNCNFTVDFKNGIVLRYGDDRPPWTIGLIDTGLQTNADEPIKGSILYMGHETLMLV